MADVLIRNLDRGALEALKRRAKHHRTSLQQELKGILEEVARSTLANAEAVARRISRDLARKDISFHDSGAMQAEDRLR
jgi:plasmid stability protein